MKPRNYGKRSLQIRQLADGTLRFAYDASPDLRFEFSLLCEVGEPWQLPFHQLLKEYGLKLAKKSRKLIGRPWLADTLA